MNLSPKAKKWIVSSVVTFVATFCIAVLPQIDSITLETLKTGTVWGILFTGVRAAVKAVMEAFIDWYSSKQ